MLNGFNSKGETALHDACTHKEPDCVDQLLRWDAKPLISESKRYPIHCAVKAGDEKYVNFYITSLLYS